jgi:L-lactate dehydrogenase
MTFRIETAVRGGFTVFILSGRIETPAIAELSRLFELQANYRSIVLDLKDVDVVTYAAWRWSGLQPNRVIGSGTSLDSSRFRRCLAEHYGVASDNVHAYVIGEHGESQVAVISSARIAGMSPESFCRELNLPYDEDGLRKIANDTRAAGMEIVRAKGATYYGIGTALERPWLVSQAPFCGMNMQY